MYKYITVPAQRSCICKRNLSLSKRTLQYFHYFYLSKLCQLKWLLWEILKQHGRYNITLFGPLSNCILNTYLLTMKVKLFIKNRLMSNLYVLSYHIFLRDLFKECKKGCFKGACKWKNRNTIYYSLLAGNLMGKYGKINSKRESMEWQ